MTLVFLFVSLIINEIIMLIYFYIYSHWFLEFKIFCFFYLVHVYNRKCLLQIIFFKQKWLLHLMLLLMFCTVMFELELMSLFFFFKMNICFYYLSLSRVIWFWKYISYWQDIAGLWHQWVFFFKGMRLFPLYLF